MTRLGLDERLKMGNSLTFMNRAETIAFNHEFLPHFLGWYTRIEAAPGGTVGNPDAILLVGKTFLPLEVKVAEPKRDGTFKVHVRPSQKLWHRGLDRRGGLSAFFIQSLSDQRAWLMPGYLVDEVSVGKLLAYDCDMTKLESWLPSWIERHQNLVTSRIMNLSKEQNSSRFRTEISATDGHGG